MGTRSIIDYEDAKNMRERGARYAEIADKYCVSKQAVYQALRKNGNMPKKYSDLYSEIPYLGLRDFVMSHKRATIPYLAAEVLHDRTKRGTSKMWRMVRGQDTRLSINQIKDLQKLSGMSFEELFAVE